MLSGRVDLWPWAFVCVLEIVAGIAFLGWRRRLARRAFARWRAGPQRWPHLYNSERAHQAAYVLLGGAFVVLGSFWLVVLLLHGGG
jgi:hypothetical protein